VQYKKLDALVLLQQLGVSTISRDNAPVAGSISDDDLERLLRGYLISLINWFSHK
jgi:hypothetical protein